MERGARVVGSGGDGIDDENGVRVHWLWLVFLIFRGS